MRLGMLPGKWRYVTLCLLVLLCGPLGLSATQGADPVVAVVYPQLREPYRGIFRTIQEGIEAELKLPVVSYMLPTEGEAEIPHDWIERNAIQAVIALGKRSERAVRPLAGRYPVVIGGVLMSPDMQEEGNSIGITLDPDPELLFEYLNTVAPDISRVTVVYNPARDAWLIEQAKRAAQGRNITLSAQPARNLSEAAKLYKKILNAEQGTHGALWLLQDPTIINSSAILPVILKKSWEKRIIVFSSNPTHVKRGALFSLFPDNENLGRSLAKLAVKQIESQGGEGPSVSPLRDLNVTLNRRTAEHLGIKLTRQQLRDIDLIFPQE